MQALRMGSTAAALLLASVASAQLLEGFEHGNPGLYSTAGGTNPNFSLTAASAHSGALGSEYGQVAGPFWYYRTDVSTQPGTEYACYVRFTNSAGNPLGRVYVGVGASPSGCWSMVAAPNTNQIILQNNSNYGFVDVASAPFTFAPDAWYQMRLEWAFNGDMTVRVFDSQGVWQLAATPTVATGLTTPGGLALRGFTTAASAVNHVDDISTVYCPGHGPGACSRADWTRDLVIDFNDFLAYLNDYNNQDPCADLNGDGVVDFNDFLEFLNLFNAGC